MIMTVNFKSTVLLFVAALFFLSCETPSNGNADEPTPPAVEEDDEEDVIQHMHNLNCGEQREIVVSEKP